MEKMPNQPIDWQGYRDNLRQNLEGLPLDELKERLAFRERDLEGYEAMYGAGNNFASQAIEDINVLRSLVEEKEKEQQ